MAHANLARRLSAWRDRRQSSTSFRTRSEAGERPVFCLRVKVNFSVRRMRSTSARAVERPHTLSPSTESRLRRQIYLDSHRLRERKAPVVTPVHPSTVPRAKAVSLPASTYPTADRRDAPCANCHHHGGSPVTTQDVSKSRGAADDQACVTSSGARNAARTAFAASPNGQSLLRMSDRTYENERSRHHPRPANSRMDQSHPHRSQGSLGGGRI